MKKLLTLMLLCTAISFCFLSCSSNSKKSKILVKEDLVNVLVNPEVIEILDQSKLFMFAKGKSVINDSLKSKISGCGMAISFFQASVNVNKDDVNGSGLDFKVMRENARRSMEDCIMDMDTICIKNNITPTQYIAKYKIRIKNDIGQYKILEAWYIFDSKIEKVEGRLFLE